jgi:hypothetical protein
LRNCLSAGLPGVRAAIAAGEDLPAGTPAVRAAHGAERTAVGDPTADTRPVVLANGFTLSPHAETCSPGASLKDGPAPFGTPVPTAQATDNSH